MARWIAWTLLTVLAWGIWAILFRFIPGGLTPAEVQVISTLGILPVLAALGLVRDSPVVGNRSWGIALALGSGILSCLGNIACYEALNHGKAAIVIPLTALYPLATVLLAIPLLNERLNSMQVIGVASSLAAIYFMNAPQPTEATPVDVSGWLLWALAAVVLWGVTALIQKMATNYVSARIAAIWFLTAFIPFAGAILAYDRLPPGISTSTWVLALGLGFALALGNYTLLLAFAGGGNASVVVPLAGLYPLVSIPIAILGLGERLGWREGAGVILALVAVVLISRSSSGDQATTSIARTDSRP